ncbi:Hypothetical protein A7982_05866 [Minicystis rosea]|nr:Hypothetical protein A7982_05866 [Minicystis rosea]
MSDDTQPAGPREAAPAPPPARWIERLSAVLLLGATALALAAAAPALLRSTGAAPPSADPFAGLGAPIDLRHEPPEILANPDPFVESDHEADPDDVPSPLAAHARLGFARSALSLRERPESSGRSVGEVKAGELVMIVRESGDWVLVWVGGADNFMKGWARKSGIAVR